MALHVTQCNRSTDQPINRPTIQKVTEPTALGSVRPTADFGRSGSNGSWLAHNILTSEIFAAPGEEGRKTVEMATKKVEDAEAPQDLVDKTIKFLAKREGIDKTLKLIRYSSRLIAAVSPADSETRKRFDALQSSVGTSRKAFRLGKFLQDVNKLRKSNATGEIYLLEALAYGGEGIYYFIEQFVWLMKTGALSKTHEKELAKLSAWAEFLGYLANITMLSMKLKDICQKHKALHTKMEKHLPEAQGPRNKDGEEEGYLEMEMEISLRKLTADRALQIALVVQDVADAAMAINDIRGGVDPLLNHPITLALAGLISGSISAHKNWNA
eukprot:gene21804-28825_t